MRINHCIFSHIMLWFLLLVASHPVCASSDEGLALRTDFLYWLTTTPNIGVDRPVSKHISVSATFGYNSFNFFNRYDSDGRTVNPKLHHWMIIPEARYWFRNTFHGSFASVYALGGQYNAGGIKFPHFLRNNRYEGWGLGAGVSLGYQWHFSPRWGIEVSAGAAYVYLRYDKYECGSCGRLLASRRSRNTIIPRATLSIIYTFPTDKARNIPDISEELLPISTEISDEPTANVDVLPQIEVSPSSKSEQADTLRITVHYDVDKYVLTGGADTADLLSLRSALDSLTTTPGITLLSIRVTGYASPEHTYYHNLRLSEKRAQSLSTLIEERIPFFSGNIVVRGAGEDWEGVVALLRQSNLQSANKLIELIRTTPISEGREEKLRQAAGAEYANLLSEIFAPLRRAEIEIAYNNGI